MTRLESRVMPRISCAKLGEYMVASPTRRRRIIQDQKWPSDFIVPLYTEAHEVIAGFIRRCAKNTSMIERAIDRLLHAPTKSDWDKQKNALCIDALKAFITSRLSSIFGATQCAKRQFVNRSSRSQASQSAFALSWWFEPNDTAWPSRRGRSNCTSRRATR